MSNESNGYDLRISVLLTHWYNDNKRDLPWRNTTNPYKIWVSEVILQQTRVDQGRAYYDRFMDRFPEVQSLAEAEETEVLKMWQGLGYYSRARNMHAAARVVVNEYGGTFPQEYKNVLSLKGVGVYTAAAIVSFAYNTPYAVVDGNVYRVLSRLFAIDDPVDSAKGKKVFALLAQQLLDEKNPGLHNQSIMELGALQCVPVSPDCGRCPLVDICVSFANNTVSSYPVKEGKTKVRNRYFSYLDIHFNDTMYLHKREEKDIWQNLYELPLIETAEALPAEELQQNENFIRLMGNLGVINITFVTQMKHILSHQIIYASFYRIVVADTINSGYLQIKKEDVDNYPISRLVERYLEL